MAQEYWNTHGIDEGVGPLVELLEKVRRETIEECAKVCERPQMTRGDFGESFVHAGARRCAANIRSLLSSSQGEQP